MAAYKEREGKGGALLRVDDMPQIQRCGAVRVRQSSMVKMCKICPDLDRSASAYHFFRV